jgi:Cof subfamily protein (haloacid dehalogenase superfamily)
MKVKQVEDMEAYVNFVVPKFLMVGDPTFLAEVEVHVKDILGDNFSVYRSDPYFLEVLPQGIDKAQCLGQLLHLLNMDVSEMIACGDGYNDLTMVQYAGLGVAMANAVPQVLAAANYVTASNDEDGVAQVVEKFLL